MWTAGIVFTEARKVTVVAVKVYTLETWWWAVPVGLGVCLRWFGWKKVQRPCCLPRAEWRGSSSGPRHHQVCWPQCCGLCSDGHVLGNREGPPSDWPGKGRRFPERCSQGISRKAWRAQGGWESMDRRHHGEAMVGNSELLCGNSYLPSIK